LPPKKKKSKKVVKKVVKKKTAKEVTPKDKALHELIRMIRHTQEHCDYINDEVNENAFEIQKLIAHMAFMDHNLLETRKMLEFVVTNMNPRQAEALHKKFEIKKSELGTNKKDKKRKEKDEFKKFAMHDNITPRCRNCNAIGLITEENCKECGAKI